MCTAGRGPYALIVSPPGVLQLTSTLRKGNKYEVDWEGIDPATNKPWDPSWVFKKDCTN